MSWRAAGAGLRSGGRHGPGRRRRAGPPRRFAAARRRGTGRARRTRLSLRNPAAGRGFGDPDIRSRRRRHAAHRTARAGRPEQRASEGMFTCAKETPFVARIERRVAEPVNCLLRNGEGLQLLHYHPGAGSAPRFDFPTPVTAADDASLACSGQRAARVVAVDLAQRRRARRRNRIPRDRPGGHSAPGPRRPLRMHKSSPGPCDISLHESHGLRATSSTGHFL